MMQPQSSGGRPRKPNSKYITTKSGNTIKIKRSLTDKYRQRADAKAQRKAERLKGLPKSRVKRVLWRLHPKRQAAYWFSRDGAIMALKIAGIGIIAGFIMVLGIFAYFRKDLPNLRDISGGNIGGSIQYYDRTGQTMLWEDYDGVKRIPVKSEEIPKNLKNATIAIEDRDFYKHNGFNTKGIIRAGVNNTFGNGGTQGGSTITQQLVKLTQDWTKDRTYKRKIKELILAVELERSYSKDDILTGYLNAAPYGGILYGAEASSQSYFRKSAKDLTLDEATFLAAIPKSPSVYSPRSANFDRKELLGRQNYTLDVMYELGMISKADRDQAKSVDVLAKIQPPVESKYTGIKAPYFVLAAKQQLYDKYVPSNGNGSSKIGGWKVTTTVDLKLQQIAEEEVAKGINQVKRQRGNKAAFVAEDVKTGQIVAVVGGTDFNDKDTAGQVNFATRPLPPGSSYKPYDYAALIENTNNFGAGSVLYDTQGPLEGYPCTNKNRPKQGGNCLWDYDFRYPGPVTLRYALGGSRNVPAVKAMLIAGVDKTISMSEKLGLKSGYKCYEPGKPIGEKEYESQCYSSSAIGDGAYLHLDEHVHAYASFSRNGVNLPQTYILKIQDSRGKVIDEWKQTKGEQAIKAETAYIIADMMADPRASYFSNKPHNYKGHRFSLKTGTTNDGKDGWLMGYSTQYAAGVWVGHHTGNVEMSGFMETMTEPIWGNWMRRVHNELKPEDRVKPAGLQTLPAYIVRTHVGVGSIEPSPSTDLFPSWFKKKATTNKKQTIDRVSNKLATECTPSRAKQDINETDASTFSGDTLVGNNTAATDQKDDIHKCDDVKPGISFSVITVGPSQYQINASVTQGTHPISSAAFPGSVTFSIDGAPINNCTVGGSAAANCTVQINGPGEVPAVTFTSTYDGSRTILASVVDSVLYDGSNSQSVALTMASSGGSLSFTSAERGGGKTTFTWSGGTGPFTVYRDSDDLFLCTATASGNTCNYSSQLPVGTVVRVEDKLGKKDTTAVTN